MYSFAGSWFKSWKWIKLGRLLLRSEFGWELMVACTLTMERSEWSQKCLEMSFYKIWWWVRCEDERKGSIKDDRSPPTHTHPAHILGNLVVLITMDALYNSVIPWWQKQIRHFYPRSVHTLPRWFWNAYWRRYLVFICLVACYYSHPGLDSF